MGDEKKRIKSFNLKESNAEKIEKIAFDNKIKQSEIVDEAIEGYDHGGK